MHMKHQSPIMRMGENDKKPKKGYVWAFATAPYNPVQAVIYDFQDSRSGQHTEEFLKGWQGHLVCDDYSGYKARFKSGQVRSLRWAAWPMHVVNSMNCK